MGLGYVGAGGTAGLQAALRRMLEDRFAADEAQKHDAQQAFENDRALSHDQTQNDQFNATMGLQRDNLAETQHLHALTAGQQDIENKRNAALDAERHSTDLFNQNDKLVEEIPANTALPADDPTVPRLQQTHGSLLMPTTIGPGMLADDPANRVEPKRGFLKMPTAKQGDTRADNERQADAEARAAARDAATAKREDAMVRVAQQNANTAAQKSQPAADGAPSPYSQERETRTRQSVDELLTKVSGWNTGMGSLLSSIPSTDARNFAAELQTLKANIAFNELTQMREASKTGGALGQVSNQEENMLSSALGALDPGQSSENVKAQLNKIKASLDRWSAARSLQGAPGSNVHVGATAGPAAPPAAPTAADLIKKYGGR